MLKQILHTLLFLVSSLMADQHVSVTATVNRSEYADKNIQNLQKILLEKAKLEAASQIFGDFIKSESMVKDGSLIKDLIVAERGGIIHIQGNPEFANGKNLGELQVSINAYATQKDIEDMKIHRIDIKNYVYGNKNLTLVQLKEEAKKAFVIEAISKQKPSIKTVPNAAEQAKKLASSVNIQNMDFDPENLSFTISGYVEYIPIFLRNTSGESNMQNDVYLKMVENHASMMLINSKTGAWNTDVAYDNNGLHLFDSPLINLLQKYDEEGDFQIIINARLLIPETINSEKVVVNINRSASELNTRFGGYSLYINDSLMTEAYNAITSYVIHENGQRYVNLSILLNKTITYKLGKDFTNTLLLPLSKLTFSVEDTSTKQTVPLKMATLERDDPGINQQEYISLMSLGTKASFDTYTFLHDGSGFVIDPKILQIIAMNDKRGSLDMRINARILLPNTIQGNKVTIRLNGAKSAFKDGFCGYNIYINDTMMQEIDNSVDADIIRDNGQSYVNLSILTYKNATYEALNTFSKIVLKRLAAMNFVVSDGGAFQGTKIAISDKSQSQIPVTLKTKPFTTTFQITHNGHGFILGPKSFDVIRISDKEGPFDMRINAKLMIPDTVKNKKIKIQLNGAPTLIKKGSIGYSIAINNKTMHEAYSSIDTEVKTNSNGRYVDLSIQTYKNMSYASIQEFESIVIKQLGGMNFTVIDGKTLYNAPVFP